MTSSSVALERLVIDPQNASRALDLAVERRLAGERFAAEIAMEHPGITAALRTASAFERRYPDPDARRAAYDALEYDYAIDVDPRDMRDLRILSRKVRAVIADAMTLANGVCVRSWYEHEIIQIIFDRPIEPIFTRPIVRELPPFDRNERRYAVFVWAPHLRSDDCALFAAALDDERATVFVVSSGKGVVPSGNAQFVGVEHAGEVLGRAAVVVDATTLEPSWAIAFANAGFPLVCNTAAGAHDYLEGASYFEPWQRGALGIAVARARALPPPMVREAPAALFAAQTRVERHSGSTVAVRVGDASSSREARVRLTRSTYDAVDVRTGDDTSRVPFALTLADDVRLFPDALGTLVDALERSGAAVAEASVVRGVPGKYVVDGSPDYALRMRRVGTNDERDVVRVRDVLAVRA